MALSTPMKALSLIVFLLLIGGATYGVQVTLGDSVSGQLVKPTLARETLNATAGRTVTYAITLLNTDVDPRDLAVEIVGAASGRGDAQTVPAGGSATYLVEVDVPADLAPGDYALDVRVLEGADVLRERAGALELRVLDPLPAARFEPGDGGQVLYTGRITATGRVFNTNDPLISGLNFPKTDTYRPSTGLLPISARLVPGFLEGIVGMQPGESRTFTFPPEKGYGNATNEERIPREDVLDRTFVLDVREETVGRDVFEGYVQETGQGTSFEVGDVFFFEQLPNRWPYRITQMDAAEVTYVVAVEAGQVYTLMPFWPETSEVVSVNDTAVEFYTTPTTAVGETFTMRAQWPNMTTLESVNETHVVVRHSPPVGHTYGVGSGAVQTNQATVRELTDDEIVIATPATNPLAGKDLTFDVLLVTLEK